MSTVLGSTLSRLGILRSAIGSSRPHQLGILIGKAPRNSCDTTTARIYDTWHTGSQAGIPGELERGCVNIMEFHGML